MPRLYFECLAFCLLLQQPCERRNLSLRVLGLSPKVIPLSCSWPMRPCLSSADADQACKASALALEAEMHSLEGAENHSK